MPSEMKRLRQLEKENQRPTVRSGPGCLPSSTGSKRLPRRVYASGYRHIHVLLRRASMPSASAARTIWTDESCLRLISLY
jgi:hypothetical protein